MTLCKCSAEICAASALNRFYIVAVMSPKEQRTVTTVSLEKAAINVVWFCLFCDIGRVIVFHVKIIIVTLFLIDC